MAQNLATKFSPKVDERFKLASRTESVVNQDYDWTGVDTVKVYSVDVPALGNYTRSGTSRYGTPGELGTALQTLTLSQDKSTTFTVDQGNYTEEMMVTRASTALRRFIDEVVIPAVDKYRLSVMANAADDNGANAPTTAATDETNAYEIVLELNELLSEAKAPEGGRVLFITPAFYKFLKLDDTFVKQSDRGQQMTITGQVGEIDGNAVVRVPSNYLPGSVDALLTHRVATVAPKKLEDYKIHDNPPGINGWLAEFRLIHDAFVLDNKVDAIAIHGNPDASA